jgi:ABC-type oligopeptide transport system substrate-binding subunit
VLKEWVYGQGMSLEANPYYFAGPPATPRIQVRFLEHSLALRAFAEGEVDILDWETISPEDVETFALAQAQQEGRVRLVTLPAAAWELLAFSLRK